MNNEMNYLKEWAEKYTNEARFSIFTGFDKDAISYYEDRNDDDYLTEYSVETLADLKNLMAMKWKNESYMQEIMKVVLVAAMKNKIQLNDVGKSSIQDDQSNPTVIIPDYIYNF